MTSPSDPIESSHQHSREALASRGSPHEGLDAPGFYLLDDCDGRFEIDRDWGVISLKDESALERERGAVHVARIRVVEQSGETYELDLKLRMSGPVPQLVSDGAFDEDDAEHDTPQMSVPRIHWTRYVAVAGLYTPASLPEQDAPYGAMLRVHMPSVAAGFAGLTLIEDLPSPASRDAIWTI
jgi:hypothetical protein